MSKFSNHNISYCGNCGAFEATCGGRCSKTREPKAIHDDPEHHNLSAKELKKLGLWNK